MAKSLSMTASSLSARINGVAKDAREALIQAKGLGVNHAGTEEVKMAAQIIIDAVQKADKLLQKARKMYVQTTMITRIVYYFKLKKLLQEKDLMQFVKYELQTNGVHKRKSLFGFCISHLWIPMWLDTLVNYFYLRETAFEYAKNDSNLAEVLIKRYNQANDYWHKNAKR